MTVKLHVWLQHGNNVGHVSLEVDDTYVSFWPGGRATKRDAKLKTNHEAAYMPTLAEDVREEGRKPDETLVFDGLDEEAMLNYWVGVQSSRIPYQLVKNNCSTVVAACLEAGSGAKATFKPSARAYGKLAGLLGRGVWTPDQVLHYARELKSNG